MPERIAKIGERCFAHPGRVSVARCDGCGRTMCIACAVPVRGRALCPDCVAAEVGPAPPADPEPARLGVGGSLTGVAMAIALAATIFPWTRFGAGSGAFGAWVWPFRWSLLAAAAATIGVVMWIAFRFRPAASVVEGATLGAIATVVGAAALLAVSRPPPLSHTAVAPWVACGAAAVGLVASLALVRRRSPR